MPRVGEGGCQILRQDDYIKAKLIEMGWRFGQSYSGGHMAGQLVMQTIANRVRAGWGTWLQVIDNIPNYMAENELPPLVHPHVQEPAFIKLLQAVDGIFDGNVPDGTLSSLERAMGKKGAIYWGDLARIERAWFLDKIVRAPENHDRIANINGLTFWR